MALLAGAMGVAAAQTPKPMTFVQGRFDTRDCVRNCAEFIVAQGEIGAESVQALLERWGQLARKDLPLLLDSPGGRLDSALMLGRALRRLGIPVIVARPVAKAIAADGVTVYAAQLEAGTCRSACVYTFAGGLRRSVAAGSTLGVHQFYGAHGNDPKRKPKDRYSAAEFADMQRSISELAAYLADMHIDAGLLTLAAATSPQDIRILTSSEAEALRLTTPERIVLPASQTDAPTLRPAFTSERTAGAQRTERWPLVERNGQPWLVLSAESQSRRYGKISNEIAIGCSPEDTDFAATFREILAPGLPPSHGIARIANDTGSGLPGMRDIDGLRGTISRDLTRTAIRTGAIEVEVVSTATANHPMRVTFDTTGISDGVAHLERACATR